MKKKTWTEQEIDFLFKYCGSLPINLLIEKFNSKFGTNRTRQSIACKIGRLGLTYRVELDCLSKLEWAKIFGFNHGHVMTRWERKGLKVIKFNSRNHAISIKDMRKFANEKPHLFTLINKDILLYYFDEELVNKISKSNNLNYKPQKVKASDGRIFSSLREASRKLNISLRTISSEVKRPDGWLKVIS